jgi:hypothetical protein
LKKNHLCLVAKANHGEILGGVVFMIQEHHAFVISVAVNNQYQRNRIGSSLMRIVEEIVIFDVNRIEVIAPKWLGFFKRSYCLVKKALNFKIAPSGVPYQS